MNPQTYLASEFPQVARIRRYESYSAGYKRQADRAMRVFDRFMERKFPGQTISIDHLYCYMMYRCIGDRSCGGTDVHNGAISLRTFRSSEVVNLIKKLEYLGRVSFSARDFIRSELFQGGLAAIGKFSLSSKGTTHARPLYPQDEERLRSCLTKDTASLRDESLIILLRASGARSASVTAVRIDLHVLETSHGALEISVPSCKTEYNLVRTVVLMDSDAEVLRNWISVRKTMFPSNPFLFVTLNGAVCDTNDITQMLYKLGQCAGYGPKFFTSHSFRVGYASTVTAKVFARGGNLDEAIGDLQSQNLWSRRSPAVRRYIDKNVFTFFRGGYNFTYEDFVSLSPERLHGLSELHPAQRRPLTWFHHPREKLERVCAQLQVQFHENQTACRYEIGKAFQGMDTSFALFAREAAALSRKGLRQILAEIVGCILNDQWIEVINWTSPAERAELMEVLRVKSYPERPHLATSTGQRTEVHNLYEREQAEWVGRALGARRFDRMVHIGRLPDGNMVRLRVRSIEENIPQLASFPSLDPDTHFPTMSSDNINMPTPPRISEGSIDRRVTPSTVASTPPMNRGC